MPLLPLMLRFATGLPTACLAIITCWLSTLAGSAAVAADYAIVVSAETRALPAWADVVAALEAKHADKGAVVLEHDGTLADTLPALQQQMPAFTCVVARPEEAGRAFVAEVHQLTRQLDTDPYTDTLWGILTGFDAANALAIAQHTEPLMIQQVTSGTELAMDRVMEGAWFSELQQNRMVVKARGKEAHEATAANDTTASIANRLSDGKTDLFVTSGHATERDWQIGFRFRNGSFRSQQGQLFGVDSSGKRFDIHTTNPKVWMPIGNCLAGHIDSSDALALAFMNAAGVHQMLGYTVPTWFGYAGWGCLDYFVEQPGRYTLAEAFHANAHALIHRIGVLEQSGESAADLRGLRFDRDVVAFYGDPAWEARMAAGPLNYEQTLTTTPQADGSVEVVLEVNPLQGKNSFLPVNTNGSQRGGRPVIAFLPERLVDRKLVDGDSHHPVLTDRFVLVPNPGAAFDGEPIRVVFTGMPVTASDEAAR